MVKGIARRVVIVDSPDRRFFEQAIFIVRNNAALEGVSADALVEEARKVAREYVVAERKKQRFRLTAPLYILLGAGLTALAWILVTLFT